MENKTNLNFERSPLVLSFCVLISAFTVILAYYLLKIMNPWGFFVAIPAAFFPFQTLWLLIHPFARLSGGKIEILQSFFHLKSWYFTDIKKVTQANDGKLYITYHDGEIEPLNLFGIKNSHKRLFKIEIEKHLSNLPVV